MKSKCLRQGDIEITTPAGVAQKAVGGFETELPHNEGRLFDSLPLAKLPQADEPDFPSVFCQDGLACEGDFPENPRFMLHREFGKAAELQREPARPQIVEQRGFQAPDDHADDVLSFLPCWQS